MDPDGPGAGEGRRELRRIGRETLSQSPVDASPNDEAQGPEQRCQQERRVKEHIVQAEHRFTSRGVPQSDGTPAAWRL